MTESDRIKKHYLRPAIYIEECEWNKFGRGKLPNCYRVERYVWISLLLREYRVAIPEEISEWAHDETSYRLAFGGGIQTRFVTYLPTGRQVYENTMHPSKAVVFEYELEHYVKSSEELKHLKHL